MKIVLVDGNPDAANVAFGERLAGLARHLEKAGHDVESVSLREKTIHRCIGCFACWIKTPGVCVFKDDHVAFLKSYVHADLVIYTSPLILGFPSALLKSTIDRIIPSALPYIEHADGECRHPLRYGRSARMAVLYEPEPDTDEEDIRIVRTAFERYARNAHSRVLFVRPLTDDYEEVHHALARL